MNLLNLKIFLRSREARTLALIIIIFAALVVPFHTVVGHYRYIEALASKYLPGTEYVLIDYPDDANISSPPYTNSELYIFVADASLMHGDRVVKTSIYSFDDAELTKKYLGISLEGLASNECLVSRLVAVDLGVDRGDSINIVVDGVMYSYRVAGYVNTYPVVVPKPIGKYDVFVVHTMVSSRYSDGAFNVYSYGGYLGLVRGLGDQVSKIVGLWSMPILLLTSIGIFIALLRLIVASRESVWNMRDLGLDRMRVIKWYTLSSSIIIILSTLVGISLGIVISQVVAKLLYVLYGLELTPVLTLNQFTLLSASLIILGHITLLSTLPFMGLVYGEAD